ncbi:hypothetical protein OQA88_1246 [Cercophora sp. LCS_1]
MMSFFSSPFYAPSEPTFTPLFRLLDDFDSYNREAQQCQPRNGRQRPAHRAPALSFKPKFDVRETETTYELHGELAGIERENLNIEFTDPQTLVVHGRIERTYESKPEETPAPAPEETQERSASPSNFHRATVEDDPEEPSTPRSASPTPTPAETPKTEVAKVASAEVEKAAPANNTKVWLSERSVGEFTRTFTFPGLIDQEGVNATLENGILSVTVPKVTKPQTRRIAIF